MNISSATRVARGIDGKRVHFQFHISWCHVKSVVECVQAGMGEDGQCSTPETYPHRLVVVGIMNEIPVSLWD